MNKKRILFYLAQEYYWPSLKPIYDEFHKDNERYDLYLMFGKNQTRLFGIFLISNKKNIESKYRSEGYQITDDPSSFDMVFCGAQINKPERFGKTILCNVDHGPGIKTLRYRHLLKQKNTTYHCFLEGQYRVEKFKKYELDLIHHIHDTGLPKLDIFFNGGYDRRELIQRYRLNPKLKTILYAPSYKPTSIFMMIDQIEKLTERYNLIVKLHPFSWSGKYAPHSQHRLFENLVKKNNNILLVHADDHNILPYMFVSDTMISDGSSVINEYLALGRCGIIVDLPEERHRDGVPLLEDKNSEWLADSYIHINPEDIDLFDAVEKALNPDQNRMLNIEKDRKYIFSHLDGHSSMRVKQICEHILTETENHE